MKNYGLKRLLIEKTPNFIEELKQQVKEETKARKEQKRLMIPATGETITSASDSYQTVKIGNTIVHYLWNEMGLETFFRTHTAEDSDKVEYLVCKKLCASSGKTPESLFAGLPEVPQETPILEELDNNRKQLIELLDTFSPQNTERNQASSTLDYLCLSITTYIQQVTEEKTGETIDTKRIAGAISEPFVIYLSPYLGVSVTDNYLKISNAIGMPPLQKTMTPVQFKAVTKLDIRPTLLKLVGKK